MEKKTVNELPGTPSLYKEVLRSDWDKAQATIEQQAREIERLQGVCEHNKFCAQVMSDLSDDQDDELASLRAQQPGVVLPERKPASVRSGYRALGTSEGWNACLDEVARLNSSPVSVGVKMRPVLAMILNALDRDAAEGRAVRGEMAYELRAAMVEASEPVSAGGVDDRAAFEVHMRVGGYSNHDKHPDGSYVSSAMELWWQGWKARAALTASAQSVPDGWVLVPVEATTEMVEALKARIACTSRGGILNAGNALNDAIAAAPAPGKGGAE